MLINPFKFIKVILWILSFLLIIYAIYAIGINIHAKMEYEPNNVAKKFVSLIENPTDRVTEEEKAILKNITEGAGFLGLPNLLDKSSIDESKIRELREIAQKNPIQVSPVILTGESKKNGTVELVLTNNYRNEKSKKAKIYLQEYGNWYLTGFRWRIFQIDMPEKDNPLNSAVDNLKEKQQGFLQSLFGKSQNSTNSPSQNSQSNTSQNQNSQNSLQNQNLENPSSKVKCNFWERC